MLASHLKAVHNKQNDHFSNILLYGLKTHAYIFLWHLIKSEIFPLAGQFSIHTSAQSKRMIFMKCTILTGHSEEHAIYLFIYLHRFHSILFHPLSLSPLTRLISAHYTAPRCALFSKSFIFHAHFQFLSIYLNATFPFQCKQNTLLLQLVCVYSVLKFSI